MIISQLTLKWTNTLTNATQFCATLWLKTAKSFGPKMKSLVFRLIWALLAIPAFIVLGGLTFLIQMTFNSKEAGRDFVKGLKELFFYIKNGSQPPYEEDLNDAN
jgi:hypothetical protein